MSVATIELHSVYVGMYTNLLFTCVIVQLCYLPRSTKLRLAARITVASNSAFKMSELMKNLVFDQHLYRLYFRKMYIRRIVLFSCTSMYY